MTTRADFTDEEWAHLPGYHLTMLIKRRIK
jgi:hypothetical protein